MEKSEKRYRHLLNLLTNSGKSDTFRPIDIERIWFHLEDVLPRRSIGKFIDFLEKDGVPDHIVERSREILKEIKYDGET